MPTLINAKEFFNSARNIYRADMEEVEMYRRVSLLIPSNATVEDVIIAFRIILSTGKISKSILTLIGLPPFYVDKCENEEFAKEFRKAYQSRVMGITKEDIQQGEYDVQEVNDDEIDISSKDIAEVLAGLYNASVPIGMGFAQYDPDDMTPEVARYIIERYNEINPGEDISFDYLKGRPLKCHFKNNILYARNYNANNAPKLAQRVVSRCKNVREIKLVQEKKDN